MLMISMRSKFGYQSCSSPGQKILEKSCRRALKQPKIFQKSLSFSKLCVGQWLHSSRESHCRMISEMWKKARQARSRGFVVHRERDFGRYKYVMNILNSLPFSSVFGTSGKAAYPFQRSGDVCGGVPWSAPSLHETRHLELQGKHEMNRQRRRIGISCSKKIRDPFRRG